MGTAKLDGVTIQNEAYFSFNALQLVQDKICPVCAQVSPIPGGGVNCVRKRPVLDSGGVHYWRTPKHFFIVRVNAELYPIIQFFLISSMASFIRMIITIIILIKLLFY